MLLAGRPDASRTALGARNKWRAPSRAPRPEARRVADWTHLALACPRSAQRAGHLLRLARVDGSGGGEINIWPLCRRRQPLVDGLALLRRRSDSSQKSVRGRASERAKANYHLAVPLCSLSTQQVAVEVRCVLARGSSIRESSRASDRSGFLRGIEPSGADDEGGVEWRCQWRPINGAKEQRGDGNKWLSE